MVGRNWLADSITKAERILDPLLVVLLTSSNMKLSQRSVRPSTERVKKTNKIIMK